MKILVLYNHHYVGTRKTISDHLYCLSNYTDNAQVHYCPIRFTIPRYITLINYDAIILHYTFLADRRIAGWLELRKSLQYIKAMKGHKIAMPQDDYLLTNWLCDVFKECGVETVYTPAPPCDFQTLYPTERTGIKHYFTSFPGFVDEKTCERINQLAKSSPREIDVGYRGRKLPFWLGSHAQLKRRLGEAFKHIQPTSTLRMDISIEDKDAFYGDDWIRFVVRCRTMLGCLGGARVYDPDGAIMEKVKSHLKSHPVASFEEVRDKILCDHDQTLNMLSLGPRHFECAMARTCQVLVEGDYKGVFEPHIHYIEIKKDFSNLDEVISKIKDAKLCEKIAERTYQDVVASGEYTYRKFALQVIEHIRRVHFSTIANQETPSVLFQLVGLLHKVRAVLETPCYWFYRIKLFVKYGLPRRMKKWYQEKRTHKRNT